MVLGLTACASSARPKHVSGAKFERAYIRYQTVVMEQYFYAGESNGCIYISHLRLPQTFFSKQRYELLYTETNGLAPDFLQHVRQAKPEGPRTYWSGKRAEPKD